MKFPDGSDPSKHYFPPGSELPRGSEHSYHAIVHGRSQSGDTLIPSPTPRIAKANNVKLKEAKIRDLERLRAKSKTLGGLP